MSAADLVRMANDIGRFFEAEPRRADAVAAIAEHLRRFWDPRMRKQILAHVAGGGSDLIDIVREAVEALREP